MTEQYEITLMYRAKSDGPAVPVVKWFENKFPAEQVLGSTWEGIVPGDQHKREPIVSITLLEGNKIVVVCGVPYRQWSDALADALDAGAHHD